ncbi:MAG TPA: hypothetical protein PKD24_10200 [Pyrinomonadaceae bacterium]|nr:hypothetical protein [Pyrinomonadaceae bacterium]HMP65552.1 hypothetical protein [Pyrinomonadaceae bacterium]
MILFTILFLIAFLLLASLIVQNPSAVSLIGIIFALVLYLGIVVIFQIAFWGMARRKSYGRWMCIGVLSLVLFFSVMGTINRPKGPFEYYEYENSTQAAAGLQAQIALTGSLLALILVLAFSNRVKDFFDPNAMVDAQLFPANEKSMDSDPKSTPINTSE